MQRAEGRSLAAKMKLTENSLNSVTATTTESSNQKNRFNGRVQKYAVWLHWWLFGCPLGDHQTVHRYQSIILPINWVWYGLSECGLHTGIPTVLLSSNSSTFEISRSNLLWTPCTHSRVIKLLQLLESRNNLPIDQWR